MNLNDKISMQEDLNEKHKPGLWARTQILGGYDRYTDRSGISQLGEVVFSRENMVPIGGVQYVMERLFEVSGSITIGYLNSSSAMGYGSQAITPAPSGQVYPGGHKVCLFGVGIGGAASNSTSAYDVRYNETNLANPVPFKFTDNLTGTDIGKYYGKKQMTVGDVTKDAYYLKAFDSDPTIKHLWKDGVDYEDGTEVDSSVFTSTRTDGIQTFTEILMTITKDDLKGWFEANGNIEEMRINEIALFSGYYNSIDMDYERIMMFSKLNIPTEPLSVSKDLNIIYRVFGS